MFHSNEMLTRWLPGFKIDLFNTILFNLSDQYACALSLSVKNEVHVIISD